MEKNLNTLKINSKFIIIILFILILWFFSGHTVYCDDYSPYMVTLDKYVAVGDDIYTLFRKLDKGDLLAVELGGNGNKLLEVLLAKEKQLPHNGAYYIELRETYKHLIKQLGNASLLHTGIHLVVYTVALGIYGGIIILYFKQ